MCLLVPELLKFGGWDIIKAWSGKSDIDIEPRIALQIVNESEIAKDASNIFLCISPYRTTNYGNYVIRSNTHNKSKHGIDKIN
ncbi:MAG: hypothetical protein WCX31_00125 [Salinivirgaceae bacterium]